MKKLPTKFWQQLNQEIWRIEHKSEYHKFIDNRGRKNMCQKACYFTEATKAIASIPLVVALVPLKCRSRNFQFPRSVPFIKEKIQACVGFESLK